MIFLASASPRRRELLGLITPNFEVDVSRVDETPTAHDPERVVIELGARKCDAVAKRHPRQLVIGCDTLVWVDDEMLGKPKDIEDARRMIELLQGRTHSVFTGVVMRRGEERLERCSHTLVEFAPMSSAEIDQYLKTEEVLDKAGAYAIQEGAAKFVRRIDGSFTGVVGLPVELVYHMLKMMKEPILETEFWNDEQGAIF